MARYVLQMQMTKLWRFWFRRKKQAAARLIDKPLEVLKTAERAAEKSRRARSPLGRVWGDLQAAVRLARAWGRREYRGISRGTFVLLLGALVYFVSPIDAIIDALPVVGLVDDAAVLAWVLGQVRAELDAFREWESQRQLASG